MQTSRLSNDKPDASAANSRCSEFPATHWTLVERLRGGEEESTKALEALCRSYWYPIYATLRRSGHARHDAEDLTQGFFADVLEDRALMEAREEKGRLRSFLQGMLKRFVAEKGRHRMALKRGGGMEFLSLEWERANRRFSAEPADLADPEKVYQFTWAHSLLDGVRERMRSTYAGREDEYLRLEPFLESEEECVSYRELGASLGLSESGARVAVYRLRRRFRELLVDSVRQTVMAPEEVEEEMTWLLGTLARRT